jgi:hypothetical protein
VRVPRHILSANLKPRGACQPQWLKHFLIEG